MELITPISKKCPECNGKNLITDYSLGEVYCGHCGRVVEDLMFNSGNDYRNFEGEDNAKRKRDAGPITPFSIIMGRYNIDIRGNPLPPENRQKFNRLRRIQYRMATSSSKGHNLKVAVPIISRICSNLKLSKGFEKEATKYYRQIVGKIKGRSIEALAGACVYLVSRLKKQPLLLDDICKLVDKDRRDILFTFKLVTRLLGIYVPPPKVEYYIPSICSQLGIPAFYEQKAIELSRVLEKKGELSGRNPRPSAMALIYLVTGGKVQTLNFKRASIREKRDNFAQILNIRKPLTL